MTTSTVSAVKARPRRAALLLVCVVSLVLIVVLLELGLRGIHAIHHWREWRGQAWGATRPESSLLHQASSIPGLDYEMAPNRESSLHGLPMKTNQFGMRDNEAFSPRTESPCRIAVLGDSYTFGVRVREEEAYPKVIEKLLRQSSARDRCRFEVLNFGVVGYSSYDEDLMFKYRVANFNPRVVILGYVLNDPECDAVQPLHAYFVKQAWWQPYRLLTLAGQVETNWEQKRFGGGDYYVYLHAQQRKWQSVVDAFSDIHQVAERRNIKVLVAIFPMITPAFKGNAWTRYPYARLHKQVADLAAANGFRVVDLRDAFSEYPSQDLVFSGTDDHPNARGHEVAAQAIEKELLADFPHFFDVNSKLASALR